MFGHLRGTLTWQCSHCLGVNKDRLHPLKYKVKCKSCARKFGIGIIVRTLNPRSSEMIPDDMLMRLDGGVWRGGNIHVILCTSCNAAIEQHMQPKTHDHGLFIDSTL